jgi:hypothetical protein
MRSILLSACFIVLASSATIAQSNMQAAPASASHAATTTKAQFTSGIKALDNNLQANNKESASTTYKGLQTAMEQSLRTAKTQILEAKTDQDRTKYNDLFKQKMNLYSAIHEMSKDLTTNREAIQVKLNEFAKVAY